MISYSMLKQYADLYADYPPYIQWVIIDTKVYDLTKFADLHPGGLAVLLDEDIGTCILSRSEMGI